MNKRRKFFSGYALFCICWAILSLGLSVFSVLVRHFGNSGFNKVIKFPKLKSFPESMPEYSL